MALASMRPRFRRLTPQLPRYSYGAPANLNSRKVVGDDIWATTYESEMAESYRARAMQLRAIADADRELTNAATLRSIAS
jgi:hypothetical protein